MQCSVDEHSHRLEVEAFICVLEGLYPLINEFFENDLCPVLDTAVAALALKNRREIGGGAFDVIFQSKGISN